MSVGTAESKQAGVPPGAEPADRDNSALKARLRQLARMQEVGLIGVLVALVVFFAIEAPGFMTSASIRTLLVYLSVLGVLSVGQAIVIIGGGFDLSNGSILAFASCIGAFMLAGGWSPVLSVFVTVLVAVGIGLLNGVLVAVLRINAFIATLATYLIFMGWAYVITNSTTVSFPLTEWGVFGRADVGPVPVPVIILVVVAVIAALILRQTTFGRSVFAIGGNRQAARFAGIPVTRNTVVLFVLSGLTCGIGALIQASLASAGSATYVAELNLQSITAVILGGAALSGGEGGIFGTVIGVVIMNTILQGLTLMNTSEFYQDIVTGVVLLLAVALAQLRPVLASRSVAKRARAEALSGT